MDEFNTIFLHVVTYSHVHTHHTHHTVTHHTLTQCILCYMYLVLKFKFKLYLLITYCTLLKYSILYWLKYNKFVHGGGTDKD
jgi:hypothetical protein